MNTDVNSTSSLTIANKRTDVTWAIDPFLLELDDSVLVNIATCLDIKNAVQLSSSELITAISKKFSTDGKDQHLARAWFPKDATSYIEVLVAVCKHKKVDIRHCQTVSEIEAVLCSSEFQLVWQDAKEDDKRVLGETWKRSGIALLPSQVTPAQMLAALSSARSAALKLGVAGSAGVAALVVAVVSAISVFENKKAKPDRLMGAIAILSAERAARVKPFVEENPGQAKKNPWIGVLVSLVILLMVVLFFVLSKN